MVNRHKIQIPELTGEEERNLYIYLPDSYDWDRERYYPVLYMFDGHNVFFDSDATYGKCWGMKEYMDHTNTQVIIVAVECNHSPDNGRLKEYAPFSFHDARCGSITAKGAITMDWMVHTLKPQIDRDLRTLSDREHTFIAGSSMGGLMSLYAVAQYNSVFGRAAALSPSVWTNVDKLEQLIRRTKIRQNTVIYMDYGSVELEQRPKIRRDFERIAAAFFQKKVLLGETDPVFYEYTFVRGIKRWKYNTEKNTVLPWGGTWNARSMDTRADRCSLSRVRMGGFLISKIFI